MSRLAGGVRNLLLALQYFTRIPVTGALADWVGFSPEGLRASAAHFPAIGWVVGVAACVAFAVLSILLPPTPSALFVAAIGCTIATAWLTGGFHEDGLADTLDGLGGHVSRERALAIMKDSRLGSYGAIALVLALGMKVALLAVLGGQAPAAVLLGLLAAHTVSRFWPLLVVRALPHVGDEGGSKSKPIAASIDRRGLLVAGAWCLPPLALLGAGLGVVPLVMGLGFSALGFLAMRRLFARRLQGFTGDCLGATQQVCEIAFYLGVAAGWGR